MIILTHEEKQEVIFKIADWLAINFVDAIVLGKYLLLEFAKNIVNKGIEESSSEPEHQTILVFNLNPTLTRSREKETLTIDILAKD